MGAIQAETIPRARHRGPPGCSSAEGTAWMFERISYRLDVRAHKLAPGRDSAHARATLARPIAPAQERRSRRCDARGRRHDVGSGRRRPHAPRPPTQNDRPRRTTAHAERDRTTVTHDDCRARRRPHGAGQTGRRPRPACQIAVRGPTRPHLLRRVSPPGAPGSSASAAQQGPPARRPSVKRRADRGAAHGPLRARHRG